MQTSNLALAGAAKVKRILQEELEFEALASLKGEPIRKARRKSSSSLHVSVVQESIHMLRKQSIKLT